MQEKEKPSITRKHIIWGSIIVLTVWIISGLLTHHLSYQDRGTFGDMFGGVNALFSGFALFGIILSIYLQRQELGLQRQEMQETRQEFKQSRLTNILFKKVEFVNKQIKSTEYYVYREDPDYAFNSSSIKNYIEDKTSLSTIKNWVSNEKYLFGEDRGQKLKRNDRLLEFNKSNLSELFGLIARDVISTKTLLEYSKLEHNAIDELLFIYSESIDPDFKEFIYKLNSMKDRKQIEIAASSGSDFSMVNFLANIENLHNFFYQEFFRDN